MGTVRGRVTLVAFLVTLAALTAGALLFVSVLQQSLTDEIDRTISNRAWDVATGIDINNTLDSASFPSDPETFVGVIEAPFDAPLLDIHNDDVPDPVELIEVFDAVGFDEPVDAAIESITLTEGSDNLRIVFAAVESGDEIVAVARTLDGVDRLISTVRTQSVVVVPLLALLVAALVHLLTGRALRPVEAIRSEVETITASDLSSRVPEGTGDDEIARLARTMNAMLGRVESSQVAQRRFASDAAHELRSPLASMRAQLDVDLAHPDRADWPATAQSVHGEVERMQLLVDDLLTLARSDAAQPAVTTAALVDLDDLVMVAGGHVVVPDHIRLDLSGVSAATTRGDSGQLQRVVTNVLANAMRHARSTVTVSVAELDGRAQVVVDDDGDGIAPEDRRRIFERFVRLDEARSRDAGGSGLGLALAREVAAGHGGTLVAEASDSGGARFVLDLPGG